jgi:hypothetical protein
MKKLLLCGIAALFLATGTATFRPSPPEAPAHTARADETLDETALNALVASGQRPHPQEVAGAVHYAPGTYPFPAALTPNDEWALRTHLVGSYAPPDMFDHPYSGDLYVIDNLSLTDLHMKCQSHTLGCADRRDRWCLVYIARETDLFVYGVTINLIMRHEIGHCNGWGNEHSGARSFITEKSN